MSLCPCGSQLELDACCKPIMEGAKLAPTAEALMRARYTAHALQSFPFLDESTHPEFRDEVDIKDIEQWSSQLQWDGLEILATEKGGADDVEGFVSFRANYSIKGIPQNLTENAVFRKEGENWFYVEGDVLGDEPYRREEPKVGRNEPCPCGSGKKHKKCCLDK